MLNFKEYIQEKAYRGFVYVDTEIDDAGNLDNIGVFLDKNTDLSSLKVPVNEKILPGDTVYLVAKHDGALIKPRVHR